MHGSVDGFKPRTLSWGGGWGANVKSGAAVPLAPTYIVPQPSVDARPADGNPLLLLRSSPYYVVTPFSVIHG